MNGIPRLQAIQPTHLAGSIEALAPDMAALSIKVDLVGRRMLFDWLVVDQVVPSNRASSVRGTTIP